MIALKSAQCLGVDRFQSHDNNTNNADQKTWVGWKINIWKERRKNTHKNNNTVRLNDFQGWWLFVATQHTEKGTWIY